MLYELLIRGKNDGTISGSHIIEFDATGNPGPPRSIRDEDWTSIVPGINVALTNRIAALEEELATALNSTLPNSNTDTLADAKSYQLKIWLIRNNIPLETVPNIIRDNYPEGPEREEALIRWEYVDSVPYNHPLVSVVAAGMTPPITVADVWPEILAI